MSRGRLHERGAMLFPSGDIRQARPISSTEITALDTAEGIAGNSGALFVVTLRRIRFSSSVMRQVLEQRPVVPPEGDFRWDYDGSYRRDVGDDGKLHWLVKLLALSILVIPTRVD